MIDGEDFQVIGVVEKPKGGFGMDDEDRRVLIPYNTFRKIYPGAYENQIRLQAYPNQLDPGGRPGHGRTSAPPQRAVQRQK